MKRRQFMSCSLAAAGTVCMPALAAMDCYVQRLPGVQLFTVRQALASDADAALADLVNAGIREVEVFGLGSGPELFGMPVLSFATLLERHGLVASSAHIDGADPDIAGIARNARLLGLEHVVLPVGPGFIQGGPNGVRAQGPQNRDDMDRLADLLNRLGRQFRTEGLLFGYHNHHVEFWPVGDDIPYDYVMWNTDPQFVRCELDIGWIALAGMDYLQYLDRYGNRTLACHLKDFNGTRVADPGDFLDSASHLLPPGSGTVDFMAVLERMDYYGIRHGYIEIDQSSNPLAAIASGQFHLATLRPCRI